MGYPHRIKPEGETWYHLYASTAAKGGEYPLEPGWVREKFRQTFMFYARAYRLEIGAFCIIDFINLTDFLMTGIYKVVYFAQIERDCNSAIKGVVYGVSASD